MSDIQRAIEVVRELQDWGKIDAAAASVIVEAFRAISPVYGDPPLKAMAEELQDLHRVLNAIERLTWQEASSGDIKADQGRLLIKIRKTARDKMLGLPALPATYTAECERLRAALETIADEQKIYKGHGDYDTEPLCSAAEAQLLALAALKDQGNG